MSAQATGGGSPIPPDPGAIALMICLCGLVGACGYLAHRLARKQPRHRPVFVYFALLFVGALLQVPQWIGHNVLAWAGPHEGWRRVIFHISQAGFLVDNGALPWLALAVFAKFPPGPTTRWARRFIPGVFAGAWLVLVYGYPEIRGETLRQAYLAAELLGLFVGVAVVGAWGARWRSANAIVGYFERGELPPERRPVPAITAACVGMLIGAPLVLLLVGAWRYGLSGPAYEVQQAGLLAVYGALAVAQAFARWRAR